MFLTNFLEWLARPNEKELEVMRSIASYESQARQLRDTHDRRSSDPLPIGDVSAMRLQAGNAYQIGPSLYRVSIHDRNNGSRFDAPEAPFAAYGDTASHARARAEQLISALDGARRL